MRLAFFGSAAFALPALEALRAAGHEIALVYTQPPKAAGRGLALTPNPVHAAALRHGLPVRTPRTLRSPEEAEAFAALAPEAAVVAAYGLILPPSFLAVPPRGALNIHASLLPRWRGAAPIQAAILAGDPVSGVTIMQMDEGLDTGPILLQEAVPLPPDITAPRLHDQLAALGAALLLRALTENPPPRPQPAAGACYAPKLSRADGVLDWTRPADELERRVRALNPWPGTATQWAGRRLKILAARAEPAPPGVVAPPGTVIDEDLGILCGAGVLRPERLQLEGRAALERAAFLRGHPIAPGSRLG
jgi:methionyl-tRNA formyltransferase